MKKIIGGNEYHYVDPNSLIDGHQFVDLGLPSRTLWASSNVGANSPYEIGSKFAWGEISPCYSFHRQWYDYKFTSLAHKDLQYFINRAHTYWRLNYQSEEEYKTYAELDRDRTARMMLNKYIFKTHFHDSDNKRILEQQDDVAHVIFGGRWRMPTKLDFEELIKECEWDWRSINGVSGALVTGRNGKSIFFPADSSVCKYWTSVLSDNDKYYEDDRSCHAENMFASSQLVEIRKEWRTYCFPVRPVCKRY